MLSGGLPDMWAGPEGARAVPESTQQGCAGPWSEKGRR